MNNENNGVIPTPQDNTGVVANPTPVSAEPLAQSVQPLPNEPVSQPAQPIPNVFKGQTLNESISVQQVQATENVSTMQQPIQESQIENLNIADNVQESVPVVEQPIPVQQNLVSEEVKNVDTKPEEPKQDTIKQTVQSFYDEPKKKKSKAVPFLVFIIILLCLGIVAMYLYYNGYLDKYIGGTTNSGTTENKGDKGETVAKTLDINSTTVSSLMFPFLELQSDLFVDEVNMNYFFKKEKILSQDIDDRIKLYLASIQLFNQKKYEEIIDNETKYKKRIISGDAVNNMIKQLLGDSIQYKDVSLERGYYSCMNDKVWFATYDSEKNQYIYTEPACGGSGPRPHNVSEISSAKEYSDKLEVVQNVLFIDFDDSGEVKYVYKDIDKNSLLYKESIDSPYKIDNDKEDLQTYSDNLSSYKYTFIKNDKGNYYFSSVEKVK